MTPTRKSTEAGPGAKDTKRAGTARSSGRVPATGSTKRSRSTADATGTEAEASTASGRSRRRSGKAGSRTASTTASRTASTAGSKAERASARAASRRAPEAGTASASPARGAVAAGAERASGERRRRAGTPLLQAVEPVEVSTARRAAAALAEGEAVPPPGVVVVEGPGGEIHAATAAPAPPVGEAGTVDGSEQTHEPVEGAARRRRPSRASIRARRGEPSADQAPDRGAPAAGAEAPQGGEGGEVAAREPAGRRPRLRAIRGEGATGEAGPTAAGAAAAEELGGAALEAAEFSTDVRPGPTELVELAVNMLRAAAASSGVPAEDIERHVAETLAYIRRRLTGDFTVDEFGFDKDWTTNVHLPILRPLYKSWFRVEVKGVENIPSEGGALLVANHSGTVALDSLMTQVAVHDEHPAHRHLRMLGADLVFRTPFIGTMARRSGSTLADNCDAERLLRGGHVVGVWPEGFKGVGKPFSERYKLQRFGRGGFVSAALRAGVPIIPCSIVGAEEIYPIIGNLPSLARLLGLPYVPVTPTFPLLGPLGLMPLPSKWLIEFGAPIDTAAFGEDAADDPMLVFDLTDQVRETIQQTLYSLLMQRKSVFL